ncbi:MAG: phosphoglycerate mutase family protein [Clostridia bacterium]|nr:phosphoglycerate mutase family protein [Clostridia bacterium]
MRILFIRHGEPDYKNCCLTKKGEKESEILSHLLVNEKIDYMYTSPLNRAMLTAIPTENKINKKCVVLDWLREFHYRIKLSGEERDRLIWDYMPKFYCENPELRDEKKWCDFDFMKQGQIKQAYEYVTKSFDEFLTNHGYKRNEKGYYDVIKSNKDTIAFFCHFGIESVLISRLINISPEILLQNFCAAPSSITTVYTEEREKGIAQFRVCSFGDTSHLYNEKEEISFAARFKEVFEDEEGIIL